MSLFPHPPQSSTRRIGRGGVGNLQYDLTAQEPDRGPENHLLPKTYLKSFGPKSRHTGIGNWQLGEKCHSGLQRACSVRSPTDANRYMPMSPEPGFGSSQSLAEKGVEVRAWEKWGTSMQQSKSKNLAAGVGTADQWRIKLVKSLMPEADNMEKDRSVEAGLAEEWRSRVLKSLTKEFHNGSHRGSNRKKYEIDKDKVWFQKEE